MFVIFLHVQLPNLTTTRGFSTFKFVPSSNDEVIVALRTEELDGKTSTYMTAFTIDGKILLEDTLVSDSMKYEGLEFIWFIDKCFIHRICTYWYGALFNFMYIEINYFNVYSICFLSVWEVVTFFSGDLYKSDHLFQISALYPGNCLTLYVAGFPISKLSSKITFSAKNKLFEIWEKKMWLKQIVFEKLENLIANWIQQKLTRKLVWY